MKITKHVIKIWFLVDAYKTRTFVLISKLIQQIMDFTIRNASTKDISLILELLYELGRPKPHKDEDVGDFSNLLKKYLSDSDKKILVAEHNNKVVGMVSIMLLSRLNRKRLEMYIPELIVAKVYQNKGIGKELLNACILLAQNNKCYRIRLESGNQRMESHQFYKKRGFEQTSLSFTRDTE